MHLSRHSQKMKPGSYSQFKTEHIFMKTEKVLKKLGKLLFILQLIKSVIEMVSGQLGSDDK